MGDFIDIATVKVRKDHKCKWCGEPIPKGTQASYTSGMWQGDWQNRHMHLECEDAYSAAIRRDPYWAEEGFDPYMFKRGTSEER